MAKKKRNMQDTPLSYHRANKKRIANLAKLVKEIDRGIKELLRQKR